MVLRNAKHERYARLRAECPPPEQAAKLAGIETKYPGNIARIDRRADVRARVTEIVGELGDEAIIRAKRARIEEQLNLSASLNLMKFAIRENGRVIGFDWDRLAESEYGVAIEELGFDKKTGMLVRVTRDNRLNAIAQLRDMLGFKASTKLNVSETDGEGKPVTNADRARALAAFIAETQAEMAEKVAGSGSPIGGSSVDA